MKRFLLTGAAFVAMTASPAMAAGLDLDLAGHFKGYGIYNDNDEAAGVSLDDTAIRKETEVHFTGETTLDNGLTVGVHVELEVDRDDAAPGVSASSEFNDGTVEESYMYVSGGWGRINFGEEDGAAYLLQVSAPSADSNVDGLRQYISTYNADGGVLSSSDRIDYDHTAPGAAGNSGYANKITYMTPVFNGFQMGASYIPTISDSTNGATSVTSDDTPGDFGNGYEVGARYEGAFEGVGMAFGAGWGDYQGESGGDAETWNVGLDLDFAGFGVGAAYLDEDAIIDEETIVVGADYQLGSYKLGASWLNQDEADLDRYTGGVSYAYGPGMSFRGSVSYIENDGTDIDSTQVLLGTQVNF